MSSSLINSLSCGRVALGLDAHSAAVLLPVGHKQLVGLRLGRTLGIWAVQQVLNAQQHLLDRDGRPPVLVFVEDGEADSAGRVDVRVEEGRYKLAFGRLGRIVFREFHCYLVYAAVPVRSLLF